MFSNSTYNCIEKKTQFRLGALFKKQSNDSVFRHVPKSKNLGGGRTPPLPPPLAHAWYCKSGKATSTMNKSKEVLFLNSYLK